MDIFRSTDVGAGSDALKVGDEFASAEYYDLSSIQFSDASMANFSEISRPKSMVGSAIKPAPKPEPAPEAEAEVNIEVFDDVKRFIDIYSAADSDKERLFLKDFNNNFSLARQFVELTKTTAHIRIVFKPHTSPEIMARQLVIIGQDPLLFGACIIVPSVRLVSKISLLERIKRSNMQQVVRGRVIRVQRRKKPQAIPSIALPTTTAEIAPGAPKRAVSGIQFPRSIIAEIHDEKLTYIAMIPPNTSVQIDKITIYPITSFPIPHGTIPGILDFDCIGRQIERPPWPYDTEISQIPREIQTAADTSAIMYARMFEYLRLLFQQYLFARPIGIDSHTLLGAAAIDFAPAVEESQVSITIAQMPQKLERLAHAAQLLGIALDSTYSTNIITDFIAQESQLIYWKLQYSDMPEQRVIDKLQSDITSRAVAIKEMQAYSSQINRLEVMARLIEHHFGSAKLRTISGTTSIKLDTAGDMSPDIGLLPVSIIRARNDEELFARLSGSEKDFILTEYDRLARAGPSQVHCEHIDIVKALRHATSISSISAQLTRLTKILASESEAKSRAVLLKCSLCNQVAICPHVLDLATAAVTRQTRQQERQILTAYVTRVPQRKIYYCRVCGESFIWSLVVDDDVEQANPENQELSDEIWRKLVVVQRYIRAQNMVDQLSFFRTIQRQIYPFIAALEDKLSIVQTSVAAEYSARLHIAITTYIFADCIVNMKALSVIFDGFMPRDPARVEAAAVKYAIDKIISIEDIALNSLPSITREVIQADLISAIGQLRNVASAMPFEPTIRDYRTALMYDPVFAILYFNCHLATKNIPAQSVALKGPKSAKMRESPAHISNPKDPFDYEYEAFKWLPTKPANPQNVFEDILKYCPSRPAIKDYFTAGPDSIARIIISNLAQNMELRAFGFPIDTANSTVVEHRKRVNEINQKICAAEEKRRADYLKERVIPLIFRTKPNPKQWAPREGKLSFVYDESGAMHQWNILIFEPLSGSNQPKAESLRGSNQPKVEPRSSSNQPSVEPQAGPSQIEMKVGTPEIFNAVDVTKTAKYVDKKCSICGILLSQTHQLKEDIIQKSLDNRGLIENFYQFFETRCPQEGAHDFDEKLQCKKCGFMMKYVQTLNQEYFQKYLGVFQKILTSEREFGHAAQHDPIGHRLSEYEKSINIAATKYLEKPWTFNYESLVNAAATFKIERHDIQILGSHEGMTREQIADESFVASVPKARLDVRILALRSYLFSIFSYYAIVKNLPSRDKIRVRSTIQFVEELRHRVAPNATIATLEQMAKEMPSMADILNATLPIEKSTVASESLDTSHIIARAIEIFGDTRKPAEIVNYYLELICTILLAIESSKVGSQICSALARTIMTTIMARENITVKAGRFSVSVVEGTRLLDGDLDTGPMEAFDGFEDSGIDAEQEDEDMKEEQDAYSLDAFDVDANVLEEEGPGAFHDPDEEEVILHIGNEVGW